MPAYVVLGAQLGDEGKGKIIDFLCNDIRPVSGSKSKRPVPADVVVRFNGGNNAGHTVRNPLGEFKLHLIPAGVFTPTTLNIIGPPVAVDPVALYNEDPQNPGEFQTIQEDSGLTLEDLHERLRISKKAHLILPWHIFEDALHERLRGGKGLGTTKRGIGPMYADKAARTGIRVGDLMNDYELTRKVYRLAQWYCGLFARMYNVPADEIDSAIGDREGILDKLREFRDNFAPCFADVERLVQDANDRRCHILFEGAQGFLLDVDHGTYPYVTSSNIATSMYSCGILRFKEVVGVVKAYTTRIGTGPLPTEIDADWVESFREASYEFGATTGRPRRIGWLDLPALQYFVARSGATRIALTRVDTLADLPELKVGIAYNCSVHGAVCKLFECVIDGNVRGAIYREMNAFQMDTDTLSRFTGSFDQLPDEARRYCDFIDKNVAPILLVSHGPDREQTIVVR